METETRALKDEQTAVERRWRVFGVRAAVTTGILVLLLVWLNPGTVFEVMSRTGLPLWLGVVSVGLFLHIFQAAKWRFLLNAAGNTIGRLEALRAHGAGLFANTLLPSIIGGDMVRLGMVSRNGSVSASVTGSVLDRMTDVASLILLAAAGLFFLPASRTSMGFNIVLASGLLLTGGAIGFLILLRLADRLPEWLRGRLSGFQEAIGAVAARKTATLVAVVTALGVQVVLVFANILIAKAIGIQVSPALWFVVFPLSKMVAFVPVSLGGLGVREGVITALLIPYAVPPQVAVAHSLVWQTVVYAVGAFGGLASLGLGAVLTNRLEPVTETGNPERT